VISHPRKIRIQFDPVQDALPNGGRPSKGISAAAAVADALWLGHDEGVSVERLCAERTKTGSIRYAKHRCFDLRKLIALPAPGGNVGEPTPEVDLEGIAFADDYLWITGSHSAARGEPAGRSVSAAIAALADVERSGNRFLLACIPVKPGAEGPALVRRWRTADGRVLRAARLPGGRKNDALTRALSDDPHLGPFLSIPSKDNGFDIEGLAAAPGGRLFLGLRGPVLDGWACVLEIMVGAHPDRDGELTLRKLPGPAAPGRPSVRYRKHFLDLEGAGVRDLSFAGRDLLVLTGPPMRGKGRSQIRLWKNALASRHESMRQQKDLPKLLELRYREKKDHAEGIAIVGQRGNRVTLMVFYDSASKDRRLPPAAMWATVHALALPR
jgi:hypothetical protein